MKLKNKILTILAACLFSYGVANAQTSASSFNKGTFYYGLEYYHYHETIDGHDPFVTIKSNPWPTFVLGYSDYSAIRSNDKSPFIYFIEGSYGRNKYTNWDSGLGNGNSSNDWKAQTELEYVLPYNIYAGLGYRYLFDKVSGQGSYNRYNQLFYLPVGYGLKMADGSNAKFQFNYLIRGNQESDLSNVNAAYPNVNNRQNNGWGLDISYVPVDSQWEIYGKYWNIDQSKGVSGTVTVHGHTYSGTVWEPHNQTYEIGFKHTF